jgi:hypothetical protein
VLAAVEPLRHQHLRSVEEAARVHQPQVLGPLLSHEPVCCRLDRTDLQGLADAHSCCSTSGASQPGLLLYRRKGLFLRICNHDDMLGSAAHLPEAYSPECIGVEARKLNSCQLQALGTVVVEQGAECQANWFVLRWQHAPGAEGRSDTSKIAGFPSRRSTSTSQVTTPSLRLRVQLGAGQTELRFEQVGPNSSCRLELAKA